MADEAESIGRYMISLVELIDDDIEDFQKLRSESEDLLPHIKEGLAVIKTPEDFILELKNKPSSVTSNQWMTTLASKILEHVLEAKLLKINSKLARKKYIKKLIAKYQKKHKAIKEQEAFVLLRIMDRQSEESYDILLRHLESQVEEDIVTYELESRTINAEITQIDDELSSINGELTTIGVDRDIAVNDINSFDRGFFITTVREILPDLPDSAIASIEKRIARLEKIHGLLEKNKDLLDLEQRRLIRENRRTIKKNILAELQPYTSRMSDDNSTKLQALIVLSESKAREYDDKLLGIRQRSTKTLNERSAKQGRRNACCSRRDFCDDRAKCLRRDLVKIQCLITRPRHTIDDADSIKVMMAEQAQDRSAQELERNLNSSSGLDMHCGDCIRNLIDGADINVLDKIYLDERRSELEEQLETIMDSENPRELFMDKLTVCHGDFFMLSDESLASLDNSIDDAMSKSLGNHKYPS